MIAAAMCFAEQHYITRFYGDMSERIETAVSYDKTDDERLRGAIYEIKDYWLKNNDLIFVLTSNGVLNDLSSHLRALDETEPGDDLYKVQALLDIFYENQKISPTNIF